MFLAREHAEEAPENHLETILRILRRQIRDWRLLPDHQFQFGDEMSSRSPPGKARPAARGRRGRIWQTGFPAIPRSPGSWAMILGPERSTIATPVSSVELRDRGKIVCSQVELLLNSPR